MGRPRPTTPALRRRAAAWFNLAFGAYLTLVGRIGADRAGYTGATIPIVAVLLSVVFEGLRLQAVAAVGIALCLAGNVLVLRGRRSPGPAAQIRAAAAPH